MNVEEFRSKIKADSRLIVDQKEFKVKEVVKFRFDDGSFYIKCFLNDEYVFADDINENSFILVKEVKTLFKPPFPDRIVFNGKKFNFLYRARATAEEIWGEEIFKKGDTEQFWDFKAADGSYLSLGSNERTNRRIDDYGNIVLSSNVTIKE